MTLEQMRAYAESVAPMVRPVSLRELEVHASSGDGDDFIHLEWNGHKLSLEGKALSDFSRQLGVNSHAVKRLAKDHGQRGVGLVDALRRAKASGSKQQKIYLTVDRNRVVHRVTGDNANRMDHVGFFDMLEGYLNTDSFEFDAYHAGLDGRIEVILRAPGEFELAGYHRERFLPGVSLRLRPVGITATQHAIRVLCDNGMTLPDHRNSVYGHGVFTLRKADDMIPWLNDMAALRGRGYHDPAFDQRVIKAINTTASVSELIAADETVRTLIEVGGHELQGPDDTARFVDLRPTMEGFKKAGIEWEGVALELERAKHLRTDRTVWDVVNGMTDLASHDYGFAMNEGDRGALREAAGKLLMGTFDLEYAGGKQAF